METVGYKKQYKMTGKPGKAEAPGKGVCADKGPSGSKRSHQTKEGSKKNVHS